MRYLSLFSGVEAASVACDGMGWEALAFAEIDPFPSAVIAKRFPGIPNLGDVTKVNWRSFVKSCGRPNLVVGGSPCQSFSIAGTRAGLDGESGLMWEYVRAVREVRPDWVLWENVPGALSSTHGEDFGCLLRSLDALGYGLAWRVLDAQFFGLAQRRERVFLVGRLGDPEGPCQVLFEPDCLQWNSTQGREKRAQLADSAGRGPARAGFKHFVVSGASGVGHKADLCMTDTQTNSSVSDDGLCGTLSCHSRKDPPVVLAASHGTKRVTYVCMADDNGGAAVDEECCGTLKCGGSAPQVAGRMSVRRLTPRECERLQGFPDDWTLIPWKGRPAEECPDGPRYKAIGNSMAVPVMRWLFERMDAYAGGGRND